MLNETFLSLFGDRLKDARKGLGLNQAAAAELTGISREHWGRCERGMTMPGGDVLASLASAGADVRYLLTGEREFTPAERLSSEEELVLDYFRQASKEARKSALRALLGVEGGSQTNSGAGAVQIGGSVTHSKIYKGR